MDDSAEALFPFERTKLQGRFRDYFASKRENFQTSIKNFPQMWDAFSLLDEIWCREFADTERLSEQNQIVPVMIFVDAHARFRIGMELGFSCCLNEALNALRFAIEAVYHACKLLKDPTFGPDAKTWLESAHSDKASRSNFEKTFDQGKKKGFSDCGIASLHAYWSDFSEISHSNMKAMTSRLLSPGANQMEIHYFLRDAKFIGGSLFWMLRAASEMEQAFYSRFESRFRLDDVLTQMRRRFVAKREEARIDLIRRFGPSMRVPDLK